jgi:hypothetical protein
MKKLHTYSTGEKVVSRIGLDMEANKKNPSILESHIAASRHFTLSHHKI